MSEMWNDIYKEKLMYKRIMRTLENGAKDYWCCFLKLWYNERKRKGSDAAGGIYFS